MLNLCKHETNASLIGDNETATSSSFHETRTVGFKDAVIAFAEDAHAS